MEKNRWVNRLGKRLKGDNLVWVPSLFTYKDPRYNSMCIRRMPTGSGIALCFPDGKGWNPATQVEVRPWLASAPSGLG